MENFQTSKKGGSTFVPLVFQQLVLQRKLGLICNSLYVLHCIQLDQPFQRYHRIHPASFRRRIGQPWGEEMPERSFNQAIRELGKKGVISVTKDDAGFWVVALSEELFSCADPAKVCRGFGKGLPKESPKPLPDKASSAPNKEHDRYLKEQDLLKNKHGGCCSEKISLEKKALNRDGSTETLKKPQVGMQNLSDTAELAEKDLISAAVERSGGDRKFIEQVLNNPSAERSQIQALQRVIKAHPDNIPLAIEALKRARGVRTPVLWLIKAIANCFKPNVTDAELAQRRKESPEMQWLKLAYDLGIIQSSRQEEQGNKTRIVVMHLYKTIPIEEAMEYWPHEQLAALPPEMKQVFRSLVARFDRDGYIPPEELEVYGLEMRSDRLLISGQGSVRT